MVEGQQAGRLGDRLGGRPGGCLGGWLEGRLEGQVGWEVVVFSKSEEQPRSTKLTKGNVASMLFGYGEDGVVVTVVGSSKTGLSWVVKAVGGVPGLYTAAPGG